MKRSIFLSLAIATILALLTNCGSSSANGDSATPNPGASSASIPTVKGVSPADGATDVGIDTAISVTFSEAMDTTSVEKAFSLNDGNPVNGYYKWDDAKTTVTFTPTKNLNYLTKHTVNISTDAANGTGSKLASAFISSFNTKASGGSSGSQSSAENPVGTGDTNVPASGPFDLSKEQLNDMTTLLNAKCSDRPALYHMDYTIDGKHWTYDEVLGEEDKTGGLAGGSKLWLYNSRVLIYVEPSGDNNVYWAARKWTKTDASEHATTALGDIGITTEIKESTARVNVSSPSNYTTGVDYRVCLVVKAPAAWEQTLTSDSGAIGSSGNESNLIARSSTGNVTVKKSGTGTVDVDTSSGSQAIEADTKISVTLTSSSGTINYTISNGGSACQKESYIETTAGSVNLHVGQVTGLKLDAKVNMGIINAPSLPPPVVVNGTGQQLVTDINNGGALLTIRTNTGGINIDQL